VTIRPKTFHAIDFHQYCNYFLAENLIVFRTGTVCADMYVRRYLSDEKNIMRFSFGVYNSKEEIDILFSTIHQYL
jgi:selenocysteine lyase/cysteine desulfurase